MKENVKSQFVIYSRKSRFTGKGESVENQVEMCRQYLRVNYGPDAENKALVYEDEGFSGGNLERPRFQKMMQDARRLQFAAIVVYRLDRISRNISDFAGLIQELGDRGIGFISVKEQFDTGSPMGRAMMYIASVFSQLERETIAERIRDNMRELAKTGRWLGGNTPLGYCSESVSKVTVDGKTKSACRLNQIPEEIRLVQLIYEKFLETGSITKTDRYLLQHQFRTRRGKAFSRFSIKAILTNPVYTAADGEAYTYLKENGAELYGEEKNFDGTHGVMAYNRTLQKPGKANELLPKTEWIVAVGAHQGAIGGKKWVQVQNMLERNRDKCYRRPRINTALLSGILVCGGCGGAMRPKLTQRRNAQGEIVYTYRCENRDRSAGQLCRMRPVSGNFLDEEIIRQLTAMDWDPEAFLKELQQGREALSGQQEAQNREILQLEKQKQGLEGDIRKLLDSLPRYIETSMESYITRQVELLHGKLEETENRLREQKLLSGDNALGQDQFDLLQDAALKADSYLEEMPPEQKRAALRLVVGKAVWDGKDVNIYLQSDTKEKNPEVPRWEDSK